GLVAGRKVMSAAGRPRSRGAGREGLVPAPRRAGLYPCARRQAQADRRLSPAHRRSRPRLCARRAHRHARSARGEARHDPRARRGARRSRRARAYPRLCRRHGRDRCPALAGAGGRVRRGHAAPRRRGRAARPSRPCRGAGGARRDAGSSRRERPLRADQARQRRAARGASRAAGPDRVRRCLRPAPRRGRAEAPAALAAMLDHLDANGRYALIKLASGALRVGISARLARTAFADAFALDLDAVEEIWHGLKPPYAPLFAWAEQRGPRPTPGDVPVFRPFMLALPLEDTEVSLDDYAVEWKWDGIRVQIVRAGGETRLYSRAGDDVTGSFPDVAGAFTCDGALDGELLVRGAAQAGEAASFNALQRRLNRRAVPARMPADPPAFGRGRESGGE